MDMYCYVLRVTNLVAMTTMPTMYIANFVNNLQKSEEKRHSIAHVYSIDHRYTNLVCMCRSTTPLFTTAILPNIRLIWLSWQLYIELILWVNDAEYIFLSNSIIFIAESQIWYVCVGLCLLSSQVLLYLICG